MKTVFFIMNKDILNKIYVGRPGLDLETRLKRATQVFPQDPIGFAIIALKYCLEHDILLLEESIRHGIGENNDELLSEL